MHRDRKGAVAPPEASSVKLFRLRASSPTTEQATVVGIDIDTLRSRYHTELAGAAIKANAKVAECLFRKATGDGRESVIAAIFWLKKRAKWSEASAPSERQPQPQGSTGSAGVSDGVADAEVRARIEARAAYETQHKVRSARLGDDHSRSVVVIWSEQTARVLTQALGNDQHPRTVTPTSLCYGRHASGQEMRMFHNTASLGTAGAPVHSYSLLSCEDAEPGRQLLAENEGPGQRGFRPFRPAAHPRGSIGPAGKSDGVADGDLRLRIECVARSPERRKRTSRSPIDSIE